MRLQNNVVKREAMEAELERSSRPTSSRSRRRRKPFSDTTNFVIPVSSVLRKLSTSLSSSSPPSKADSNATSKPYGSSRKTKPDSTKPSKSDTSIGSSSYNPYSVPIPKTPTRASVSYSGNRSEEVFESITIYKRRETTEKTKDREKSVDGPPTYSSLQKTKDSDNSDAMPLSLLLQKTKDKSQSVAVPSNCSLVNTRKDKGKARAVSFSHLGKTKGNGEAVSVPITSPSLVNTRNKSKASDMAFSCPPLPRTKKTRTESNGIKSVGLSKSHSVPPKNKKKRHRSSEGQATSTHDLPQEFVEQQRAYFKDVDDFELAEEEVSESELDNEEEKKCYNHDKVEAP